jgi:hypothetical protein
MQNQGKKVIVIKSIENQLTFEMNRKKTEINQMYDFSASSL